MLKPNTSRKLKMVSYSVTPICMHKEFFCSIVIKQVTTRLGLEKKKESMIFKSAHSSQTARNTSRIKKRMKVTILWCLL